MRFAALSTNGKEALAIETAGALRGFFAGDAEYPGELSALVAQGHDALVEAGRRLASGREFGAGEVQFLPPLPRPPKIICVGLNYAEHTKEGGFEPPTYPTIFARFASSLIGHQAPLIRPRVSTLFDYEGEVVAVIGREGRHISKAKALDHVAGYSIFNDASVRDYQLRTPQWTVGKNFDGTGAFGPWLVTPDEVPSGAKGLRLQTRLNGEVLQHASTADLIFDVATLISLLSEAFTLEVGDVIVTGTPSGVGHARTPKIYMKQGDVCEVEVEGLGILTNPILDEAQS
jgi:acylpyruvate hydrolase